jgi:glutathione S-transferase
VSYAARSRVALTEANTDFEEVEIDLDNKPDWYLKIYPVDPSMAKQKKHSDMQAGKVPAMKFGDDLIIESNVISEFVADLFPNANLRPEGHSADAALKAAKMRQFIEVWRSKIQGSTIPWFFWTR